MKKILIKTLLILMMLGASSVAYSDTLETGVYIDVNSTNWAHDAITTMSTKGIVKGYPNGSFKPDNTLTYGEFIKMALVASTGGDVGNASGIDKQTGKNKNWAQGYYEKALELKYFRETQISLSQITNSITRGDMAIIISAILGDVKIDNYDSLDASITDVDSTTKNEYDIIKSYANGILTGYADNTFKADKTLSRAEAAVITYRLVDTSKREMPGGMKEEVLKYTEVYNPGKWQIEYEVKNVKAKDLGIEKFELKGRWLKINSKMRYDVINVYVNNKSLGGVVYENGSHYSERDGYYVFEADAENVDFNGKNVDLRVSDDLCIYRIKDFTLK